MLFCYLVLVTIVSMIISIIIFIFIIVGIVLGLVILLGEGISENTANTILILSGNSEIGAHV